MLDDDRLLSVNNVAKRLGLSSDAVRFWERTGKLPAEWTVSPDIEKCGNLDRRRVDHESGLVREVFRVSSAARRR